MNKRNIFQYLVKFMNAIAGILQHGPVNFRYRCYFFNGLNSFKIKFQVSCDSYLNGSYRIVMCEVKNF